MGARKRVSTSKETESSDGPLNPKSTHYEFGGPVGTLAVSVGLVAVIETLYLTCNKNSCSLPTSLHLLIQTARNATWFSWPAFFVYSAWLFGLVVLDRVIPGLEIDGQKLRNGKTLRYKFNGTTIIGIILSLLLVRGLLTSWQLPELQFLYENLFALANTTIVYALVISTWLYVRSFTKDSDGSERLLALGGNTGNAFYDWFIGRELNPRLGNLDIKAFLEMRPGLILWLVINLSMAHHQYLRFGHVTASMILVCFFQGYYVIEGTLYESGLVSMIDVVYDGLGFMLVFGDIALVPFTYTMQTRFLADFPVQLSWTAIAAICAVYVAGLAVFRLANNEKSRFKAGDPSTRHLKYLEHPSGSKLLVTGWWGTARHINYGGDLLASLAYSLPCGFHAVPYYFIIFFAGLLVHREVRDEDKCAKKYGDTWLEYKKRVPWRIIPGIY